jgi:hypothetical protein
MCTACVRARVRVRACVCVVLSLSATRMLLRPVQFKFGAQYGMRSDNVMFSDAGSLRVVVA